LSIVSREDVEEVQDFGFTSGIWSCAKSSRSRVSRLELRLYVCLVSCDLVLELVVPCPMKKLAILSWPTDLVADIGARMRFEVHMT